jgi:hypothetical protein
MLIKTHFGFKTPPGGGGGGGVRAETIKFYIDGKATKDQSGDPLILKK